MAKDKPVRKEKHKKPEERNGKNKEKKSKGEQGSSGFLIFALVGLLSCLAVSYILYSYDFDPTSPYIGSQVKVLPEEIRYIVDSTLHYFINDSTKTSTEPDNEVKNPPRAPKQASSSSEKSSSGSTGGYSKASITNAADNKIRGQLDAADDALEKKDAMKALELYDKLLVKYPHSPRAVHGKARALDELAAQRRSNKDLEQAIETYLTLLEMKDVPKDLMLRAGRTCAEKQSFRGWGLKAVKTLSRLLELYPDEWTLWNEIGVQYLIQGKNEEGRKAFKNTLSRLLEFYPDEWTLWNEIGVQYLMQGKNEEGRKAFKNVLAIQPNNGFAKVHLGFIMKTTDKDYEGAIPYLREGIASGEEGVIDGRFYFQLGDSLYRTGRINESYTVYSEGAARGVFPSMWQRSLYNVAGLVARPWWTLEQTGVEHGLRMLEEHWKDIRDEGLANLDKSLGRFKAEDEDLREKGDWKQFTLYIQGRKNEENCRRAPKTCALVSQIQEAVSCTRGQIKFSVMEPGLHVWPHCGPTNCRIRCHLGLVVPPGPRIRVGEETRLWKEGQVIVFDDSIEHEVWHDGNETRLVLILDIWHPQVTQHQRKTLPPI